MKFFDDIQNTIKGFPFGCSGTYRYLFKPSIVAWTMWISQKRYPESILKINHRHTDAVKRFISHFNQAFGPKPKIIQEITWSHMPATIKSYEIQMNFSYVLLEAKSWRWNRQNEENDHSNDWLDWYYFEWKYHAVLFDDLYGRKNLWCKAATNDTSRTTATKTNTNNHFQTEIFNMGICVCQGNLLLQKIFTVII